MTITYRHLDIYIGKDIVINPIGLVVDFFDGLEKSSTTLCTCIVETSVGIDNGKDTCWTINECGE